MQHNHPFRKGPYHPKHNEFNQGGSGERMLNMKQEKYFRFDLDDLLTELGVVDNKSVISATILNKMSRTSLSAAVEYVERTKAAGALTDAGAERLKSLMQRYSKWR
jgi:hypothetical protein